MGYFLIPLRPVAQIPIHLDPLQRQGDGDLAVEGAQGLRQEREGQQEESDAGHCGDVMWGLRTFRGTTLTIVNECSTRNTPLRGGHCQKWQSAPGMWTDYRSMRVSRPNHRPGMGTPTTAS